MFFFPLYPSFVVEIQHAGKALEAQTKESGKNNTSGFTSQTWKYSTRCCKNISYEIFKAQSLDNDSIQPK